MHIMSERILYRYSRQVSVACASWAPTVTKVGMTSCQKCARGRYSSLTPIDSCLTCRTGSYCSKIGMTAPTKCPVGRYSQRTGLSSVSQCYQCGYGTFNNLTGSVSSADCKICPPGRYGPQQGMMICTPCPGGKYSTEVQRTSNANCQECPIHFYSLPGAGECTPCPDGFSTLVKGATSCVSPPSRAFKCRENERVLYFGNRLYRHLAHCRLLRRLRGLSAKYTLEGRSPCASPQLFKPSLSSLSLSYPLFLKRFYVGHFTRRGVARRLLELLLCSFGCCTWYRPF